MGRGARLASVLTLLLFGAAAHAQTPRTRTPLLAMLIRRMPSPEEVHVTAFRQALRERGWVEGQNLCVETRHAEWKNERLEPLATELIGLNPDVLWTYTWASVGTVARLTTTVPIVTGASISPVDMGVARSLARPGGNVTGMATMALDLEPKRVEVLRDAVPRLRRIGVLGYVERSTRIELIVNQRTAKNLGLTMPPAILVRADRVIE